jgi:hypothetical protein
MNFGCARLLILHFGSDPRRTFTLRKLLMHLMEMEQATASEARAKAVALLRAQLVTVVHGDVPDDISRCHTTCMKPASQDKQDA